MSSICFSNLFIVLISIFYKFDRTERFNFIHGLDKLHKEPTALTPIIQKEWSKKILKLKCINILKTILMNLFNYCLMGVLMVITVTFSSAFPVWQDYLMILWGATIIADFILVEAMFEIVIWLFWVCRANHPYLSEFLIGLKNLRNLY
jgi:hypothetical protein